MDYVYHPLVRLPPPAGKPPVVLSPPAVSGCGHGTGSRPARPTEKRESELKFDRDTVVPLLYGEKKIDGIALPVGVYQNKLYVCYVFCEGEIESFGTFYIDDKSVSEYSGLYGLETFTGTLSQAYSADLHTVDSNWVEPLAGTAYVVAWFRANDKFTGIPKLSCEVKGRKVYDHRNGATAYSTNPALCLLDLKQSERYGAAVADAYIDFTSWDQAATDCDEIVNSESRYSLNYHIKNPASISQLENYILLHFNGDLLFSEGVFKLNVHKSRSSVASFTQDEVWNVKLGRPDAKEYFNQVRATYTLTDTWQEDEYSIETTGLTAGDELLASASFDFTGCASVSQVHRLCVFQLNSRNSDLRLEFNTYNTQGLERLDRFTFSHDVFGLSSVEFYVLSVDDTRVVAAEYSESLFSDAVIDDPAVPEADLPSPLDTPAAVTNLALSENFYLAKDTHFNSVVNISFTASASDWIDYYEIWTKEESDDYVLYGTTDQASAAIWTTGREVEFFVKIIAVNKWLQKSSAVEASLMITGKIAAPVWPDDAELTGEEAGDVAILTWDAAVDIDTVRYKIRRGTTTDDWNQAADVATIDALNYFDRSAPAATWRYFVKAVDSQGNYSEALHVDVDVTINPNLAFNRNQPIELTGATVNQVAISPSSTASDQAFPLDPSKDIWSERFSAGADWDDTSDAPWPLAPTSGTIIDLVTTATDMGAIFTGEFTLSYSASEFGSGTATLSPKLLYSTDGSTYTEIPISSAVTITARYIKAKFVWTCPSASNFYMITEPVKVNVKAMPVVEFGTESVGSGGSSSISFEMTFAAIDKVQLTPQGSTPVIALADNISTSGFDIKVYDTSGSATSGTVGWKVEGV